ncbi:hypothetical protein ACTMTJ_39235 [Phytohabitans sp. LJ34]|uniref:hypothetical protein n=1 Tax=Phytohabitans sp. LJ34 TaxID=3452217 RepID=UPI003F8BF83F
MGSGDVVTAVLAAVAGVANLALAAKLVVASRGGAMPRIFGRPQPLPRLRAVMHACLGLGIGVGWFAKDIFAPSSTGDTVVFNAVRVLLALGIVTALLTAFRYARDPRAKAAR